MDRYMSWAKTAREFGNGPREFPSVGNMVPLLLERSETFRNSWARQGENFHDKRIRSTIAIAPPTPVRAFDPQSLASIKISVTLITGGADQEAPTEHCADWLTLINPDFRHFSVGPDVGHYTFLGFPAMPPRPDESFMFLDHPQVNRAKVHEKTANLIIAVLKDAEPT